MATLASSDRVALEQAFGAGQGCVPVLPLDQCNMHSRPEPDSLPQDHPWKLGGGSVASAGLAPRY